MAKKTGPQDMPPKGGYAPIQYVRVELKRILTPKLAMLLALSSTGIGAIQYFFANRRWIRDQTECRSARIALMPFFVAERDREFLKQLKKNREEEAKLMEDYPGWVVGTYFGEPIYKLEHEDKFVEPLYHEYFCHTALKWAQQRMSRYQFT